MYPEWKKGLDLITTIDTVCQPQLYISILCIRAAKLDQTEGPCILSLTIDGVRCLGKKHNRMTIP